MKRKMLAPLKAGDIVNGFTITHLVNSQQYDVICACGKRTSKHRKNLDIDLGCNACKPRKKYGATKITIENVT